MKRSADDRVAELISHSKEQAHQEATALTRLSEFASIFYGEIDTILHGLNEERQRRELPGGLKPLHFELNHNWVSIWPISHAAYPNPAFPYTGSPYDLPKVLIGRIVVFRQFYDSESSQPLGEIYVFPDGMWFCYGAAFGLLTDKSFDQSKLRDLALRLFEALTYATTMHLALNATKYDVGSQKPKSSMGFNLHAPTDKGEE